MREEGRREGVLHGGFLSAWFCLRPGSGQRWEVEGGREGLHRLTGWRPPLPLPQPLPSFGGFAFRLPAGAILGQAFNRTEHPFSGFLRVPSCL